MLPRRALTRIEGRFSPEAVMTAPVPHARVGEKRGEVTTAMRRDIRGGHGHGVGTRVELARDRCDPRPGRAAPPAQPAADPSAGGCAGEEAVQVPPRRAGGHWTTAAHEQGHPNLITSR